MKIAQIAPPWIPVPPKGYGGTESVLAALIDEQVAQGHDVTVFAPGDARTSAKLVSFFPKSLLAEGVPWHAHLKAFYHLEKSIEQIKEQHFDIVHTHLSSSADLYLFPLTAPLKTPHVTTLHSHFPFDHVPGWIGKADEYYMDWAAQVPIVAISETARKKERLPLNFVGVVHNGIAMQHYTLAKPRKRAEFFAWLGRFVPEKGPHLAIEAAKRANVPLVLAGTIDIHVKEARAYFQDVIKPLVDGEQIKYVGSADMRKKVSLFSRARGFLNPIEWEEPFGMVMIEAMALGCPVISFRRGAASEIILDKKTGFLVRDVDEMVECMAQIDEIDRGMLHEYVEQNFSAQAMAKQYVNVYKEVIATK